MKSKQRSETGQTFLELLLSLALLSALSLGAFGSLRAAVRATDAMNNLLEHERDQNRLRRILNEALRQSAAERALPSIAVYEDGIVRDAFGELDRIHRLNGRLAPAPGSSILGFLEHDEGWQRAVLIREGGSVALCLLAREEGRGSPPLPRGWLGAGPDGVVMLDARLSERGRCGGGRLFAAELSLASRRLFTRLRSAAEGGDALREEAFAALDTVTVLYPLRDAWLLYLANDHTLRRASILTEERQPLLHDLGDLQASLAPVSSPTVLRLSVQSGDRGLEAALPLPAYGFGSVLDLLP